MLPEGVLTSDADFFFPYSLLASEHDGLRKDGQPDKRMSSEHGKSFSPIPPPLLAFLVANFSPLTL